MTAKNPDLKQDSNHPWWFLIRHWHSMPCCRGSNTITKKLKATNDTFVIQSVTAAAINEKWWKSSLPSSRRTLSCTSSVLYSPYSVLCMVRNVNGKITYCAIVLTWTFPSWTCGGASGWLHLVLVPRRGLMQGEPYYYTGSMLLGSLHKVTLKCYLQVSVVICELII